MGYSPEQNERQEGGLAEDITEVQRSPAQRTVL